MNIFKKRINYKPFEYPEVLEFTEAIEKSFWTVSEINFTADVQDFHTQLNPTEKEIIKRALLGIAQVEVGVKTFWGKLYDMFPKPEFNGLGSTFSHNEFIHSQAYSKLLEVLGYNDEFVKLLEIPVFQHKLNAIQENLGTSDTISKLLFFTLVIENCSLFSQFAIMLSFPRFKGIMKNVSNVISWTSVDEEIHANAGIYLINTLKKEGVIIDENHVRSFIIEYLNLEEKLLNWIFEKGELSFFSKNDLLNFMKYRIDESLKQIGLNPMFNITNEQYYPMKWFDEEIYAGALDDFFAKRPTEYTKHDKPITADDLF